MTCSLWEASLLITDRLDSLYEHAQGFKRGHFLLVALWKWKNVKVAKPVIKKKTDQTIL